MQLNPYLMFKGNCQEAFEFYERALGGKIETIHRYAGSPAESHIAPEWRDKVMHARLIAGGQVLMGSDAPPEQNSGAPQGFSVSLTVEKTADADRIFQALSEGGYVRMPIQKTFWALRFGMLVDRFGVPWMVNCEGDAVGKNT